MSPLASIRGTGGSINDTAVKQNQNTLTHPYDHTKGEFLVLEQATGSWTVPDGVTKVCIVVVGAGGGGADMSYSLAGGGAGGGGLTYGNNITVKPGDSLPYQVGEGGEGAGPAGGNGGDTWIKDSNGTILVMGEGGEGGSLPAKGEGGGGGYPSLGSAVDGGGHGGDGNYPVSTPGSQKFMGGGGGGAGGYSGTGGYGGFGKSPGSGYFYAQGQDGGGGGGGGGMRGTGGGGVGLYGEGSSGEGGEQPGDAEGEGGSPTWIQTETAQDANEPGSGNPLLNNAVTPSNPEIGSGGGEDGYSSRGGACGGGGASGGDFFPPDTGEGEPGADGGLRICWGCGVSFPDNASGNYPNPQQ